MDWFERIAGFPETDHARTQALLQFEGEALVSRRDGRRWGTGRFETQPLSVWRARAEGLPARGRTRVALLRGDVRQLHTRAEHADALVQVASQFNALEMISPEITPELGVTRYALDPTQGPACAIAAGAATLWRHYAMPLAGQRGQTAARQLDTLAPVGQALAARLGVAVDALWTMKNGYALATAEGLQRIGALLRGLDDAQRDALRAQLQLPLQADAEVTEPGAPPGQRVSQMFCSALPVAYGEPPAQAWEPLARLVLEAAYEGTLRAAAALHAAGGSPQVLLTRVGGGVFGNAAAWIDDAIDRALATVAHAGLEVLLVSPGEPHPSSKAAVARWSARAEPAGGAGAPA